MARRIMSARTLARIAVAGAVAVGGPLATAGTASAAPASTWDALAECESSGDWSINTGNGYSGGLQFSPSTWRAYGGEGRAHEASRAEQIAVAERVLDGQGWGAWPACSRELGLR
jgi:ABC-type transport system substrate-binding protein